MNLEPCLLLPGDIPDMLQGKALQSCWLGLWSLGLVFCPCGPTPAGDGVLIPEDSWGVGGEGYNAD